MGSSGSGSTTTVQNKADARYNKGLLKIQGEQWAVSQEMFDYYKFGPGTQTKDPTEKDAYGRMQYDYGYEADEGAVGYQTMESETIKQGLELMPLETGLEKALIEEQQALITARAPVREALMSKAAEDNPSKAMGKAEADVKHSYAGIEADMNDQAFRTGVDPMSGRYMQMRQQMALGKAKDVATSRTGAADTYAQTQTALQSRVSGIPAQ